MKSRYSAGLDALCRVCLTRGLSMKSLDSKIYSQYDNTEVIIIDLLSSLLKQQVTLDKNFPSKICSVCLSLLKMSYEFIKQYEASDKIIVEKLGYQNNENSKTCAIDTVHKSPEDNQNVDATDIEDDHKYNYTIKPSQAENETTYDTDKYKDATGIEDGQDYHDTMNPSQAEYEMAYDTEKYEDATDIEDDHCNHQGENEMTYDIKKYEDATDIEDDHYNHQGENEITYYIEKNEEAASVELIIDNTKYSLNQVIILERDPSFRDDKNCYKGFLKNLGTEVSAQFVKKQNSKSQLPSQKNELTVHHKANEIDHNIDDTVQNEISKLNLTQEEPKNDTAVTPHRNLTDDSREAEEDHLEDLFTCNICNRIFNTKKSMQRHRSQVHSNKTKEYPCKICGFKTTKMCVAYRHSVKHAGKQHKCDYCDARFYTKSHLKVHINSHTKEKTYLCNVCGKTFLYANALKYHMRLHTGEKNYLCRYCGKRFTMDGALTRHIRTHTGARPYKCQFCPKSFASNSEVKGHEMSHTGYRPYHCRYCNKGFTQTYNMKLHLLTHEGPINCDLCSKTFVEMDLLKMHMNIVHKISQNDDVA